MEDEYTKITADDLSSKLVGEIKKTSIQDRRDIVEASGKKTNLLEQIARNTAILAKRSVNCGINNGDTTLDIISYGMAMSAMSRFDSGQFLSGFAFVGVSGLLYLIRHIVPEGHIAKFLRKHRTTLVENIKKTMMGG